VQGAGVDISRPFQPRSRGFRKGQPGALAPGGTGAPDEEETIVAVLIRTDALRSHAG
jgi:hypothetical protein